MVIEQQLILETKSDEAVSSESETELDEDTEVEVDGSNATGS
jgi:hypothetical protein